MKRFAFPLDSLRRYKTRQKRQVENELARVRQAIALQRERIAGLRDELLQMASGDQQPVSAALLERRLAESSYEKRVKAMIAVAEQQAGELQEQWDRVRELYLAIAKEVESLDTLYRQQLADHRFENSKSRQEELNDNFRQMSQNAAKESRQ